MEETPQISESETQESGVNDVATPPSSNKNLVILIVIGLGVGIIITSLILFGMSQLSGSDPSSSLKDSKRPFEYKESSSPSTNKTTEEIVELEDLDIDITEILGDLEDALKEIDQYEAEDDTPPVL